MDVSDSRRVVGPSVRIDGLGPSAGGRAIFIGDAAMIGKSRRSNDGGQPDRLRRPAAPVTTRRSTSPTSGERRYRDRNLRSKQPARQPATGSARVAGRRWRPNGRARSRRSRCSPPGPRRGRPARRNLPCPLHGTTSGGRSDRRSSPYPTNGRLSNRSHSPARPPRGETERRTGRLPHSVEMS